MYVHVGALLVSARPVHRGNSGGGRPPPPTVTYLQHSGAVEVPKRIAQAHIAVQEGGGAEATVFGGGGGKGGDFKGVQRLWSHPRYFTVLQVPGDSDIGSG